MNMKVLMVDKDEEVLQSLRHYFRNSFQLDTASRADAGVQLLRGGTYRVVISSYRMATMDRNLFLKLVRECAPGAASILIADASEIGKTQDLIKKGLIFRCIAKPCTPEALDRTIHAATAHSRWAPEPQELPERDFGMTNLNSRSIQ